MIAYRFAERMGRPLSGTAAGLIVALASVAGVPPVAAQDAGGAAVSQETDEPAGWWERLSLSGDFRSRYEGFYQREAVVRNRVRMRLRLRLDGQINDETRLGIQIASGDPGTPVSTNQTFTGFFRPKPFSLDRAFVAYTPRAASALTLGMGKFGLPLTRTQMIFDDDLNVEGGWEQVSWSVSERVGVNLVAVQTAVNEVSRAADTYMMGGYGEVSVDLGRTVLQVSAANYGWGNVDPIAVGSAVGPLESILTNTLVRGDNGAVRGYASRFNVVDVIGQARFGLGERRFPVRLLAEYSRNTRAANDRDSGFWTEAEFGAARDAGSIEASYTYGWIEQDVTLSAFVFSDMPGTNLRLHMLHTSWMLLPRLSWDVTLHVSKQLVPDDGGGGDEGESSATAWLFRPHIAVVVRF